MRILLRGIKWFAATLICLFIFWLIISAIVYRAYWNENPVTFTGEIHYKLLEINFNNRSVFEELLANRIVRLEGHPVLYVNEGDDDKLWPESPWDMRDKGYTIKATLIAQPLLWGGYGVAKLGKIEIIDAEPIISK
ncbi:MAG: hypothetical protein HRT37_26475 [Alteromonadaceae bacterium]|nr:hypothetical protein [Alteromonadaceae bacterium]